MGCFNTTCFASQQTIAPSDKCYVLPIRQAASYRPVAMTCKGTEVERYGICHMTCYPHAYWEPVGNFLEAEYDDYGQVLLANTPLNHRRLLVFFRDLTAKGCKVRQGENTVHDIPFDFRSFLESEVSELFELVRDEQSAIDLSSRHELFQQAWDVYEEAAMEYRAFMTDNNGEPRQVHHAILHAAAYDRLVALSEGMQGWRDEPLSRRATFDRALEPIKTLVEGAVESAPESEADVGKAAAKTWMMAYAFAEKIRMAGYYEGLYFSDEETAFEPVVARYRKKELSEDALFEIVRPYLDSRFVIRALNYLNLRLTPMTYATQDYQNGIGQAYARFVQDTSSAVTAERNARYAEDDEDEDEEEGEE